MKKIQESVFEKDINVDWDQTGEQVTLSCENDSVTIPDFEFLDMVRSNEFFIPQQDWDQIKKGYAVTVSGAMDKYEWQSLLRDFNTFNESIDSSNLSDDSFDFDAKFESIGEQQAAASQEAAEIALGQGGEVDPDDQKKAYAAFMRGFMRIWTNMGGIDFQESKKFVEMQENTETLEEDEKYQFNIDHIIKEYVDSARVAINNVVHEIYRAYGDRDLEDRKRLQGYRAFIDRAGEEMATTAVFDLMKRMKTPVETSNVFENTKNVYKFKKLKEAFVEEFHNIDEPIAAIQKEFEDWKNAAYQNMGNENLEYFGYSSVEDMIEEAREELLQYIGSNLYI